MILDRVYRDRTGGKDPIQEKRQDGRIDAGKCVSGITEEEGGIKAWWKWIVPLNIY